MRLVVLVCSEKIEMRASVMAPMITGMIKVTMTSSMSVKPPLGTFTLIGRQTPPRRGNDWGAHVPLPHVLTWL